MIPSVLARQLQGGLCDYIDTTFPMSNYAFKGTLSNMLGTKNSVFRDPYVALRLPFRVAEEESVKFDAIHPKHKPYLHQQRAFERLAGEDGRSTLIATGTGSGKTECFLYPILEYCYRHRGEPGIKALIIYPMNALASDQAKRIAELIDESPELRGNVKAGMYVGGYEAKASRTMSKDRIITDHETLLASPPDILLTNYKMLDYLLVRPKDASLWAANRPDTLKYIAVDELHTFDGAQGTDLACLLRRLKARLYTQQGYLCCVGTSATMGSKESARYIRDYASSIFGEAFEENAVITEDRLTAPEFFSGYEIEDFSLPSEEHCQKLVSHINEGELEAYLQCAAESWFEDRFDKSNIMAADARLRMGKQLMKHSFMQHMLGLMENNYVQVEYICGQVKEVFPNISRLSNPSIALDALFALISHARIGTEGSLRKLVDVQVQFWMRELRRLLAKVSGDHIEYALATDLNEHQAKQYLPVVNCRDCGETGWVGVLNERNNMAMVNLDTFYNLYFSQDSKVKMVYPSNEKAKPPGMIPARLCTDCLQLDLGEGGKHCSSCGNRSIPVLLPLNNIVGKGDNKQFFCPFCNSRHGLSLMGLRSATAISAEVTQLYSSKFNDDKKLLAFSDNVQDAAHRAGFFNSRTWKFGLRGAIQRFALREGKGLSLDQFQTRFIEYWRKNLTNEEFVSFFIAPNMTWMSAYERMKTAGVLGHGVEANRLMEGIEKRIKYEIMLEYGMSSRIGRTLEKSGCSVLSFDGDKIGEIANRIRERTINELGALTKCQPEVFQRMVVGFLHIMRSNGAFHDSVFNTFTMNEGKAYLLSNDKTKWMPGTAAGRNIPRFIYKLNEGSKRLWSFDALKGNSKYAYWIDACIDEPLIGEDVADHIAEIILSELIRGGIVETLPSPPAYAVYAINKSAVRISTDVSQLVCDQCGTGVSASEENRTSWVGAPCIRHTCGGNLVDDEEQELGYYGKLYSNGDLIRVNAREHTGLLERDNREELERIFKRNIDERKPWDANLLSCTPTLEMGIDIGDLSTVVLCSMPPAQAQFLQRTGRAGRKDGNALTIVVSNARPHDLYFYAEPMEMIQGTVQPPKIYLRASAVLERQFVAYSMDSWIKRGVPDKAIPDRVGICLNKLTQRSPDIYPFNFLQFVQSNLSSLIRTFIQLFARSNDGLDEDSIRELERFAKGNGLEDSPMHMKILEAFESLLSQRDSLYTNIKQLKELTKIIENRPNDSSYEEEIKELKSELYALSNVVKSLNNKNVYNFMSDEGLLPNYAFPEAGIVLKAVLFRKEEPAGNEEENKNRKYEKMVFEYSRSASSALSEFAPANNFYVDGKKLQINQIDTTTAQPAKWRLCPNCSHAEENTHLTHAAACPRCGSPGWADAGQVRTMLKVKMVYSNMPYDKAQIGDESDDRSSVFYCKQLLVDVDEDQDIVKAYRMDNDEFKFGYEFVKKATLREINFGESDVQGEKLTVSGVEEVRKGFRICKYCGRIQTNNGTPDHTFTCRAKNPQPGDHEPYEEYLFLYREFTTEVLRILVPATTLDFTKTRQESFIAAFMLGMKEYFGNVDHLRATLTEVPVQDAGYRKQYLVLFDSVPGGTGYLKQLLQQDHALIEIFEKALTVLENCSCKEDLQKDGCYRCLFAYRQSQNIGEISRKTAIHLLRQILSGKDNIEQIDKLGNVPVNSLFESELERQFIQALEMMGNENRTVKIDKALINLKEGYSLKVGECAWDIEPQVLLDERYGVSVKSRADFVLWPRRKFSGQRPVAIYTDGFLFHKDNCADDTLKREAIRRSNQFRVWTLSWRDIQSAFNNQGDYATLTLLPENMPSGSSMYKRTVEHGGAEALRPDKATPMELLMHYLEMPEPEKLFKVHAKAVSLSLLDARKATDRIAYDEWYGKIKELLEDFQGFDSDFILNECIFGTWTPRMSNANLKIFSGIKTSEMKEKKGDALPIVCALLQDISESRTDKYEADWNGFWQFYNLMQFSDNFVGVTTDGIQQLIYSKLLNLLCPANDYVDELLSSAPDEWSEIKQNLFDDEASELAIKLQSKNVRVPSSVGYELTDANDAVIAECEMAWESEKVAALLMEQIDSKDVFENAGWTVFTLNDDIPSVIKGGKS
ncbi:MULTISPECIES: DEAD/DEAH box helicase [unclassified Paenibacillus]|uniref:DEAD/DEAH box helicase n=1 Tax=unclassified Paenibacillus TaxID=185978 RepID=UPI0023790208|nr:DEAD/DEAH box helicase [Paenibacillus sp. MAHUQ-63]